LDKKAKKNKKKKTSSNNPVAPETARGRIMRACRSGELFR
jgi:hypothetical protein